MVRRLIILNAALIVLVTLGFLKLRRDWNAFGPAHDPAAIQPAPQNFPTISTGAGGAAAIQNWTDIATRNPFSFDRSDIDVVVTAEGPVTGPRPILFGTIVIGSDRTALVAPGNATDRNAAPMKIGQVIDGWTITDILAKSIQVESNGATEQVTINDPTTRIPRVSDRTAGGAQSSAPPAPGSSTNIQLFAPLPAATPPPAPAAPGEPQRRTRVVQTPFGPRTIFEDVQ